MLASTCTKVAKPQGLKILYSKCTERSTRSRTSPGEVLAVSIASSFELSAIPSIFARALTILHLRKGTGLLGNQGLLDEGKNTTDHCVTAFVKT